MNEKLVSTEVRSLEDVNVFFDPNSVTSYCILGGWKLGERMGSWSMNLGDLTVEFPEMDWCDRLFVFLSVTKQVTSAMDGEEV